MPIAAAKKNHFQGKERETEKVFLHCYNKRKIKDKKKTELEKTVARPGA